MSMSKHLYKLEHILVLSFKTSTVKGLESETSANIVSAPINRALSGYGHTAGSSISNVSHSSRSIIVEAP